MNLIQVEKRDGRIVEFDLERIAQAISKASLETVDGLDSKLSKRIAESIKKDLLEQNIILTVENIQDMVEKKLMASNRKDIAKQYILYRDMRNKNRNNIESKYKLLDNEFISKYKHLPNPMSPLGEFVYYRTYSRWLPEEKRREYWWETCRRAVEFNCGLVEGTTKEEAQELFDNMYYLRQFLSGRTLWSGMTPTSYSNPTSQFNCSFAAIDKFSIYKDMCYLLMLGVGFGFSVEKKYVQQLPKIRGNIQVIHKIYAPLAKHKRKEITDFDVAGSLIEINVGDSKSAWSNAIDLFLRVFYEHDFKTIDTIILNYNNVRPFGEILKTFGGKASGHDALLKILDKIYKVLTKDNNGCKKLKSIDAMDIANSIAEGIVVGGTRRSAQMCLFDADDGEVMNAKTNLYVMDDKGIWSANQDIIHRMMSNNSVAYHKKPSFEDLKKRFEVIKMSAEGNFFNMEAAKKRRPNAKGTNPSMPKGVLIQTNGGIFDISELEGKKFEVKSLNGDVVEAECWLSSPQAEVFDINFGGQRNAYATSEHKFPVITNGIVIRKSVSELKIGDKIPLNRNEPQGYSLNLSYEDGLFAGVMLGDGSITKRSDNGRYVASLTVSCENIKEFINLFYNYKTGKELVWNRRSKKSQSEETNFGSQEFVVEYLMNTLGLITSCEGKDLPKTVWLQGDNFVSGFIDGLFSSDGSVDVNSQRVILTTSKRSLATNLQKLLSFYGISAIVQIAHTKDIKFPNGKTYDREYNRYDVRINTSQTQRFRNIFKLTCKKKQDKLNNLKVYEMERDYVVIKSITKHSEEAVWDISVHHDQHVFPSQHCYTGNCGEVILDSLQFCNLTTINLMGFVENSKLNLEKLLKSQKLSARAGYRNATVELELPDWSRMQIRDRLIGCSFTGYRDMVNATNMTLEEEKELLIQLKNISIKSADEYADELGLNRSECKTCLKPEGTLSLLPTVSSGGGDSHSPYYIRRIRINATDPLAKVCEELGYRMYPENGEQWETCKTKVVEFPVKSPQGKTKYDVSAIEQLERYKMFMDCYVEHNASNTISVRDNEWNDVVRWVYNNWDSVIGVTFISLVDSFYQLMPYEAITEEEYNVRITEMKPFTPSLISKYEIKEMELDIGNETCSSGACGIR